MINILVCDLIETSAERIRAAAPKNLAEARAGSPLVGFSQAMARAQLEMKKFLRARLYQHYEVLRMTTKAQRIVAELFAAFTSDPRLLPPQYLDDAEQPRRIADYIAGMTDRYAMKEHRRLFAVGEI